MNNGVEHGVQWTIDDSRFNPIIITVENIKTSEKETVEHHLLYPNAIFGYDFMDIQEVERTLDGLIKKYADDD